MCVDAEDQRKVAAETFSNVQQRAPVHSQIPKAFLSGWPFGYPRRAWGLGVDRRSPQHVPPTLLGPLTEMCPLRGPSTQKGPGASDPHFIDEEMKVGDRKDRLRVSRRCWPFWK